MFNKFFNIFRNFFSTKEDTYETDYLIFDTVSGSFTVDLVKYLKTDKAKKQFDNLDKFIKNYNLINREKIL